jgi:hypothetical protein
MMASQLADSFLAMDRYESLHWVDSDKIQFIKDFDGQEDNLAHFTCSEIDKLSQEADGSERDYAACYLAFIAGYCRDYDEFKRAVMLVTDDLFRAEAFIFVALSQVLAVEHRQKDLHDLIGMAIDLITNDYCLAPWMATEAWDIYVEQGRYDDAEELLVYL